MASKRFKGKGYADRTAHIGANCEIEKGAGVRRHCFIGHDVILRPGAYVRSEAEVISGTEIMAGVVVPSGAIVKGGYRVHAILDAGLDERGFHVIAALVERTQGSDFNYVKKLGKHWRIWAGCRDFTVEQAVAHWTAGVTSWQHEYSTTSAHMLAKVKYLKVAIKLWHKEHGR